MLKSIPEGEYTSVLEKNPLLMRHPDYITEDAHSSRDFVPEGPAGPTSFNSSDYQVTQERVDSLASENNRSPGGLPLTASVHSKASVYFEAYTGEENIDDEQYETNKVI